MPLELYHAGYLFGRQCSLCLMDRLQEQISPETQKMHNFRYSLREFMLEKSPIKIKWTQRKKLCILSWAEKD